MLPHICNLSIIIWTTPGTNSAQAISRFEHFLSWIALWENVDLFSLMKQCCESLKKEETNLRKDYDIQVIRGAITEVFLFTVCFFLINMQYCIARKMYSKKSEA